MANNEFDKDKSLKSVFDGFISAYAGRKTDVAFSDWLAEKLCQELPELGQDAGTQLANDIIEAVAGYDKMLDDLNQAIEDGQSKDEWLAEHLAEAYDGMPIDAAGEALQRMEEDLISSNIELAGEIDKSTVAGLPVAEPEHSEWNHYRVKNIVKNIGEHVNAAALFAAANALDRHLQGEDSGGISAVIKDAFHGGLEASPEEVKAVVAGTVRVAAERGLMDAMPSDMPIEAIGDMAGVAVEGAKALCDAANGDITLAEALDKAGRAGVAATCRTGAEYLRGAMMRLPGGPIIVDLLGGMLEHLVSSEFIGNVYTTVRRLAVATWEGVKQSTTVKVLVGVKRTILN